MSDAFQIDRWIVNLKAEIIADIRTQLAELTRQMESDAIFLTAEMDYRPDTFTPGDGKAWMGRLSASAGGLAGIAGLATLIGASNFWNPIGWAAGAVSIAAGLLSLFFIL